MFSASEETSNIASLLLLPLLLGSGFVKGIKKGWRPSKAEVSDSFIAHVKSDAELLTALSQRKQKVSDLALTVQPSIYIVGSSLDVITSYFVVIDDVKYRLSNILSAVESCFKGIWALNAKYPLEAHNVWSSLQVSCYKLTSKFDKVSTGMNIN
jgi:hypothetical protein